MSKMMKKIILVNMVYLFFVVQIFYGLELSSYEDIYLPPADAAVPPPYHIMEPEELNLALCGKDRVSPFFVGRGVNVLNTLSSEGLGKINVVLQDKDGNKLLEGAVREVLDSISNGYDISSWRRLEVRYPDGDIMKFEDISFGNFLGLRQEMVRGDEHTVVDVLSKPVGDGTAEIYIHQFSPGQEWGIIISLRGHIEGDSLIPEGDVKLYLGGEDISCDEIPNYCQNTQPFRILRNVKKVDRKEGAKFIQRIEEGDGTTKIVVTSVTGPEKEEIKEVIYDADNNLRMQRIKAVEHGKETVLSEKIFIDRNNSEGVLYLSKILEGEGYSYYLGWEDRDKMLLISVEACKAPANPDEWSNMQFSITGDVEAMKTSEGVDPGTGVYQKTIVSKKYHLPTATYSYDDLMNLINNFKERGEVGTLLSWERSTVRSGEISKQVSIYGEDGSLISHQEVYTQNAVIYFKEGGAAEISVERVFNLMGGEKEGFTFVTRTVTFYDPSGDVYLVRLDQYLEEQGSGNIGELIPSSPSDGSSVSESDFEEALNTTPEGFTLVSSMDRTRNAGGKFLPPFSFAYRTEIISYLIEGNARAKDGNGRELEESALVIEEYENGRKTEGMYYYTNDYTEVPVWLKEFDANGNLTKIDYYDYENSTLNPILTWDAQNKRYDFHQGGPPGWEKFSEGVGNYDVLEEIFEDSSINSFLKSGVKGEEIQVGIYKLRILTDDSGVKKKEGIVYDPDYNFRVIAYFTYSNAEVEFWEPRERCKYKYNFTTGEKMQKSLSVGPVVFTPEEEKELQQAYTEWRKELEAAYSATYIQQEAKKVDFIQYVMSWLGEKLSGVAFYFPTMSDRELYYRKDGIVFLSETDGSEPNFEVGWIPISPREAQRAQIKGVQDLKSLLSARRGDVIEINHDFDVTWGVIATAASTMLTFLNDGLMLLLANKIVSAGLTSSNILGVAINALCKAIGPKVAGAVIGGYLMAKSILTPIVNIVATVGRFILKPFSAFLSHTPTLLKEMVFRAVYPFTGIRNFTNFLFNSARLIAYGIPLNLGLSLLQGMDLGGIPPEDAAHHIATGAVFSGLYSYIFGIGLPVIQSIFSVIGFSKVGELLEMFTPQYDPQKMLLVRPEYAKFVGVFFLNEGLIEEIILPRILGWGLDYITQFAETQAATGDLGFEHFLLDFQLFRDTLIETITESLGEG